jgi:hypothetical protein
LIGNTYFFIKNLVGRSLVAYPDFDHYIHIFRPLLKSEDNVGQVDFNLSKLFLKVIARQKIKNSFRTGRISKNKDTHFPPFPFL